MVGAALLCTARAFTGRGRPAAAKVPPEAASKRSEVFELFGSPDAFGQCFGSKSGDAET